MRRAAALSPGARAWWALALLGAAGAAAVALIAGPMSGSMAGPGGGEAALGGAGPAALGWRRDLVWAQPWRWITAAWVHLSPAHLAANLAGAALVGLLGAAVAEGRRMALAWALAWPLTHLALLAQPALTSYGGLSGWLHAGVAIATWQAWRAAPRAPRPPRQRRVAAALALGLVAKLALEAPYTPGLQQGSGWAIPLAPFAHLAGAAVGLGLAAALGVGAAPAAAVARNPPAAVQAEGEPRAPRSTHGGR